MAAGCVLVRSALYVVFLFSYTCPLRSNDSPQLLKHEGLKLSTFCAINHERFNVIFVSVGVTLNAGK